MYMYIIEKNLNNLVIQTDTNTSKTIRNIINKKNKKRIKSDAYVYSIVYTVVIKAIVLRHQNR